MTSHVQQEREKSPRKSSGISLTAAAKALGVTREHLSRVLHGHRVSASLSRRFAELSNPPKTTEP
ncbi:MAG: helix-turn-helix domain-containing protein [Verrucomicrobiota bacterium]